MASIHDKAGVLAELRMSLHICDVVVAHSEQNGEPPEAQAAGKARSAHLREAIRFIEENATEEV